MAAKADLLISTDIVSRCLSEVQTGRMNNADETDKEEKAENLDCQFQIAKKVIVSYSSRYELLFVYLWVQ